MPAFYVPLIVMLLALGMRGVSFEFRPQTQRYRPSWDAVFSIGSIVVFMEAADNAGIIEVWHSMGTWTR
jgi:cytochrome d ubiquinol oxidase subunit II